MSKQLLDRIVNIIENQQRPMRTPVIEAYITIEDDKPIDTFLVRDTIKKGIDAGILEFKHPGYLVGVVDKEDKHES
mgnify:CR=1 FL=1